jgi:hypothetical protein
MPVDVDDLAAVAPRGKDSQYVVFLFPSVSHVLKAEKILKDRGFAHKLIPVPRHISADCGVCLRVDVDQQDTVVGMLQGVTNWERMALL